MVISIKFVSWHKLFIPFLCVHSTQDQETITPNKTMYFLRYFFSKLVNPNYRNEYYHSTSTSAIVIVIHCHCHNRYFKLFSFFFTFLNPFCNFIFFCFWHFNFLNCYLNLSRGESYILCLYTSISM